MKYVIFKRGELVVPVVSSEDSIHALLGIGDGFKAVSAGFFYIDELGEVVIDESRIATSFRIKQYKQHDKRYLNYLIKGYTGHFFYDFEHTCYPEVHE
jgi:hypothetical protein